MKDSHLNTVKVDHDVHNRSSPVCVENDLKDDHSSSSYSNSNLALVSYKAFSKRKSRITYALVGLLQFDNDDNTEYLNFTHRAALGGGDDADNDVGKLTSIA